MFTKKHLTPGQVTVKKKVSTCLLAGLFHMGHLFNSIRPLFRNVMLPSNPSTPFNLISEKTTDDHLETSEFDDNECREGSWPSSLSMTKAPDTKSFIMRKGRKHNSGNIHSYMKMDRVGSAKRSVLQP